MNIHQATKRYTLCLLPSAFCLFLLSCGEKEKQVDIPANVLSKEKMAQVITDIHLQEAEVNVHSLPDSTSRVPVSFQKVFDKDTITKQQYEESLAFYINNPELLDTIYVQVLNELSKMQGATAK